MALYCIMVVALAAFLLIDGPREQRVEIATFALAGLVSWPAIEYAFHRFIFHDLQPFKSWHEAHHQRPKAIIFTPTILSAALIALLVFLPALLTTDLWRACALSLGVLAGYLSYTITHHAIHHWHFNNSWLKKRKHWHALHHRRIEHPGYYGVTSAFLDQLFGSVRRKDALKTTERDHKV